MGDDQYSRKAPVLTMGNFAHLEVESNLLWRSFEWSRPMYRTFDQPPHPKSTCKLANSLGYIFFAWPTCIIKGPCRALGEGPSARGRGGLSAKSHLQIDEHRHRFGMVPYRLVATSMGSVPESLLLNWWFGGAGARQPKFSAVIRQCKQVPPSTTQLPQVAFGETNT